MESRGGSRHIRPVPRSPARYSSLPSRALRNQAAPGVEAISEPRLLRSILPSRAQIPCWKLRINRLINISGTAKNYSLYENWNFSESLAVNGCVIANIWLWCWDKLHRRLAKDREPCGVARCISNRCVGFLLFLFHRKFSCSDALYLNLKVLVTFGHGTLVTRCFEFEVRGICLWA